MKLEEVTNIANIESQLSKLWEEKKGSKRIRACLFNLIIYSFEQYRIDYLREIAMSIVQKFPCRIIFIQGESPVEKLQVSVSSEITGKGDTSFGCDFILIQAPKSDIKKVPFIILPNLVPDLPIYLLSGQNPSEESDILPQLESLATRLIFDAGCTDNLPQFSRKILDIMKTKKYLDFIDMDWLLTAGWRSALAKIFDCAAAIERLKKCKGIQILYNDREMEWFPYKDTQAVYLSAWLAAQLKWKYIKQEKRNGSRHLTFNNGSNDFEISLVPKTRDDLYTRTILGIEISGDNDHFYLVSPVPNTAKVVVHVSSLETCEMPYSISIPTLKRGFPYVQDLCFLPPSIHYISTLKEIAKISSKENFQRSSNNSQ